ncbi:hypothetical protein SCOCK_50163 [Actinacidiphila cocklensis]|uniref:Uncharacterized protein n=1 Tax=Actinacidiphila cocklensis TaxID=887465 RepID=A0A9W4E099_9ACTN|nr:hypothetical protein SCOCK_50163 [Actinacidiphila cocklensis]
MKSVHPARRHPAHRTDRDAPRGPRPCHDPLTLVGRILHDQRGKARKHHLHKLVDIPHASVNDPHDSPSPPNMRQGHSCDSPL